MAISLPSGWDYPAAIYYTKIQPQSDDSFGFCILPTPLNRPNMEILAKIFRTLKGIRLRNPAKNRVVVFDATGSEALEQIILRDIPYTVLHCRFEVFHLTPQILWRMVPNVLMNISWFLPRKCGSWLGQLYRTYLLACLQYAEPAVVLTFCDNSYAFQWLSRAHTGCAFLAVQNGLRYRYNVTTWLPAPPNPAAKISMPDFICFGEFEKDLYTRYGHKIDRYHCVGSIRGSFFRHELSGPRKPVEFDLCLLSEWTRDLVHKGYLPTFRKGTAFLEEFLARYIRERSSSLVVACRNDDPAEPAYFAEHFGPKTEIIRSDRKAMSTYYAMDKSRVVLTLCCTAGVEAMAWGQKVLFCNFGGDDNFDSPRQGLWSLTEPDYEKFKERLDLLIGMPEKRFCEETRGYARYLMNYLPDVPAHVYVRNLVLRHLKPEN